ncbi:hypothetical protein PPERSA_03092 [Pseudocohnilembus persalinus]|uniref:Transmembrane protein n=1 Tax=Pseudocohnilembus persalinus TaxID=266149 RepID=A0A0V0R8Q6_PSEPJ|nr:hypothetical protein PPERSA_03092 [Pseudocohnilembus persalinus]|eukprot:KRX10875.1 hypothetical protein PPERSA_03092 [Pseudocohnilembus persalinus]
MDLRVWIKRLFIISAFIACFTCYARPDYNLPLFAFAYLLWDQQKPESQKVKLIYLFVFTALFDLIWIFYWWAFWNSQDYQEEWASGIQSFILFLSFVNFLIKLVIVALGWQSEQECKQALSLDGFLHNAQSLANF